MDKAKFYLREAYQEVQYAKMCYRSFLNAKRQDNTNLMFFHVHHFVIHAANIDKLLNPKTSSLRYQVIQDALDIGILELQLLRRLRNHLEHFDERLVKWVNEYGDRPFFDRNLIEGTRGFPKEAFLRALDGNTFKFQGESYDLGVMIEEVRKIEKLLNPLFKKPRRTNH